MGREGERGNDVELILPRGLTRRRNAGLDVIQIAFTYRGLECRESLNLNPDKKMDVRLAAGMREDILRRIALGTFVYIDFFPNSPRAMKFGFVATKKDIRELLVAALRAYDKAQSLGNMSPSTVQGYRKIINGDLLPFFGDYLLRDVTPALVRAWMGTMSCTAKTARNRTSLLRSVLDDAVEDGLIDQNPLDRIAINKLMGRTAKKSDSPGSGRQAAQEHHQDTVGHARYPPAAVGARGVGGPEGAHLSGGRTCVPQSPCWAAVADRQADPRVVDIHFEGRWRPLPQPISNPSHLRMHNAVARRARDVGGGTVGPQERGDGTPPLRQALYSGEGRDVADRKRLEQDRLIRRPAPPSGRALRSTDPGGFERKRHAPTPEPEWTNPARVRPAFS